MIVIGVDVHKQSVTAVAVDDAGRMLDERTVPVGSEELIGWAAELDAERLWAMGPLTKGRYWEIIAVPDIREQAAAVAEDIARELGE